ncbi:hypothetical protein [Ekhidna sp.]
MKKINLISTLIICSISFLSCEKEEPFVCEKNAVVKLSEQECAFARITRTSGGNDINGFEMGIGWSTGGLDLFIRSSAPLEEKVYTLQDGASFWFNQLNRTDGTIIEITTLDKENKTISGTFAVFGEGNSNSQAYEYSASGSFTDVPY